jgi:hypothetical protein
MNQKLAVALLVAVLLPIVVHRLVAAQEAKRQVIIWHTIAWKANADPKARDEMKKLLETKLFPAAAQ